MCKKKKNVVEHQFSFHWWGRKRSFGKVETRFFISVIKTAVFLPKGKTTRKIVMEITSNYIKLLSLCPFILFPSENPIKMATLP